MKTKSVAVAVLFCFAAALMCVAQDAALGTWKLNEAKSKFSPGSPKTTTAMYESAGDMVKVTLDGTGMDGNPTRTEWTGKYDGKDYPVTGDSHQSTRSYTKINDRSMKIVVKNGDKTILSGTLMFSPDGKSRTVKASGMGNGKKFEYTAVYDKQ